MENRSFVFNCPCKSCILNEVNKFEKKKLYREADQILRDSIKYHSQLINDLEEERNKLRARQNNKQSFHSTSEHVQKSKDATCANSSNNKNDCMYTSTSHRILKRQKNDSEFSCPVAIFEEGNPKLKPMYPKHLVYANGQDIQLEEILAANWDCIRNKNPKPQIKSEGQTEFRIENVNTRTSNKNKNTNEILKENCEFTDNSEVVNLSKQISILENKSTEKEILECKNSIKKTDCSQQHDALLETTNVIKETENVNEKQSTPSHLVEKIRRKTDFVDRSEQNVLQKTSASTTSENTKDAKATGNIEVIKQTTAGINIDNISAVLENLWPTPVSITDAYKPNLECERSIPGLKEAELPVVPRNNDNKENKLPAKISIMWNDDDKDLDTSDNTCNTKAFALVLPSSTPNRRRSQVFQASNTNGTYVCEPKTNTEHTRQSVAGMTVPNLSMILELSKERSSSSSGHSVTNNINSKTFVLPDKTYLSPVAETDEKSDTTRTKFENFANPFDPNLIDYFLKKINFPYKEHLDGFCRIDLDMPVVKQASTIKLGFEKYSITGEIGKGSYARILKAHKSKNQESVALKLQKPACLWEFYISNEIQRRLKSEERSHYFIHYSRIFVYKNGSALMSEWAPYGSLLNLINIFRTSNYHHFRCPMAVSTCLGIQLMSAVQYLHSCQIIHGDIKPDNFVICSSNLSSIPCIQLIDYGRSIDMTLFPKNTVFTKVVTTEDFTCNEMKENKPWTYQTDLYGLAGTMYLLLVGEYMKTTKQNRVWVLKKPLSRYMRKDVWDPIFETLLNIPSCNDLPDLSSLKQRLEEFHDTLDKFTINQQFTHVMKLLRK